MATKYDLLWARVQQEIPGVRIVKRSETWLGRVFSILSKITGQSYNTYLTTIANTIYVYDSWFDQSWENKYVDLRHERVHLHQFRSWPFQFLARPYLWWINAFIMGFCYLFVLPTRHTMRADFEREAYCESLLALHDLNWLTDSEAIWLADIFNGPGYIHMWSYPEALTWANDTIAAIRAGEITTKYVNS